MTHIINSNQDGWDASATMYGFWMMNYCMGNYTRKSWQTQGIARGFIHPSTVVASLPSSLPDWLKRMKGRPGCLIYSWDCPQQNGYHAFTQRLSVNCTSSILTVLGILTQISLRNLEHNWRNFWFLSSILVYVLIKHFSNPFLLPLSTVVLHLTFIFFGYCMAIL